jgi:hypothetical protein
MSDHSCIEIRAGGLPCIRFENLPARQHQTLAAEFGGEALSPRHESTPAFVTVRFDVVQPPAGAVFVGRSSAATQGSLFVREGPAWARIPLGQLMDANAEFIVEASPDYDLIRLVGYVLEPLAKVRALLQGHTFIHSSAVAIGGQAVLLCAWGNTGKTNLMLKLAEKGATMLSDDWSLLMSDGSIAGYPRPVNLMNYNLDIFPHLRGQLSWKKKIVYACDRGFRNLRRRLAWNHPVMLRAGDMAERLLELGANARLPLGRFESFSGGLPAVAIVEVHKASPGASTEMQTMSVKRAARAATVCFAYENTRLLQRLSEYAYAFPEADGLSGEILELYRTTLAINLGKAAGTEVHSLGIPSRPTVSQLETFAQHVQALAFDR